MKSALKEVRGQAVVLPTSLELNFHTNQSTHHSMNTKKTIMEEEKVVYKQVS
jgi:hypothetical protein